MPGSSISLSAMRATTYSVPSLAQYQGQVGRLSSCNHRSCADISRELSLGSAWLQSLHISDASDHVLGAQPGTHEAVAHGVREEGLVHPLLQRVPLELDAQRLPALDVLLILRRTGCSAVVTAGPCSLVQMWQLCFRWMPSACLNPAQCSPRPATHTRVSYRLTA